MILLIASTAAASEVPCSADDLSKAINGAEQAFDRQDLSSFREQMKLARAALRCLEEPLTPELCGGVHRVHLYEAFLADEKDRGVRVCASMLRCQPKLDLEEDLASVQGVVNWCKAVPKWDPFEFSLVLPPARCGEIQVNASDHPSGVAPRRHPWILQRIRGEHVLQTEYVDWGEPVPYYARPQRAVLATGVGLMVVGAVFSGVSYDFQQRARAARLAGESERAQQLNRANRIAFGTALSAWGSGGLLTLGWTFGPKLRAGASPAP